MVKLGDGAEWLTHGGYTPYPNLDQNYCMKTWMGSRLVMSGAMEPSTKVVAENHLPPHDVRHHTWCYVSAKCTNLGKGVKVNDKVSWKSCASASDEPSGRDKRYADLPPSSLIKIINESGWASDPTLIPVMALPYANETWDDVKAFFKLESGAETEGTGLVQVLKASAASELKVRIQQLRESGKSMIFCTGLGEYGNGRPDACGPPQSMHLVGNNEVWFIPHFGSPVCESGCSKKHR